MFMQPLPFFQYLFSDVYCNVSEGQWYQEFGKSDIITAQHFTDHT